MTGSPALNSGHLDDLTATRLCAEAMGWECKGPLEGNFGGEDRHYRVYENGEPIYGIGDGWVMQKYRPLHDDAQAMALVKRFMLAVDFFVQKVSAPPTHPQDIFVYFDEDGEAANRAIVYCVAKMQSARIRDRGAE
jgi:hypothetical protein